MLNNIISAIIEIPQGSSNKYEYDIKTKRIKLDRVLSGANFYPAEYGFIENTLDWDGDPLDVMVLATYPTFPSCEVNVRVLGAIEMIDAGEVDTKLFGVLADDPHLKHINKLEDVPTHIKDKITTFFLQYKTLQKKEVVIKGWQNLEWALKELTTCKALYTEHEDLILNNTKEELMKVLNNIKK